MIYQPLLLFQLGRFCGEGIPEVFTSTSSEVRVVFNSDITNIRRGFVVQWSRGSECLQLVAWVDGDNFFHGFVACDR